MSKENEDFNDKFEGSELDNLMGELALMLDKDLQIAKVNEFDSLSPDIMGKLLEMIPKGGVPTLIVRYGNACALTSGEREIDRTAQVLSKCIQRMSDPSNQPQLRKVKKDE